MGTGNRAVSVNPKGLRAYGNTEAIRFGGESVETARAALVVRPDEDTVRASVKAEEAGGNDRPASISSLVVTVLYNLIGFRGEEEIGFNASTPVSVGAFQLITSAIA